MPLIRIQSVRVTQGPLQRALDLATVHVDTAGGLQVIGRHRAASDAYDLADLLATRSRAARRAATAPHVSLRKPPTSDHPPQHAGTASTLERPQPPAGPASNSAP